MSSPNIRHTLAVAQDQLDDTLTHIKTLSENLPLPRSFRLSGLALIVPALLLSSFVDRPGTSPTTLVSQIKPALHSQTQITPTQWDAFNIHVMLDRGESFDVVDLRGRTVLMWAAESGQFEIVSRLLEHGVNVNDTDQWGRSALHMAIANNHREIVKLLMDHQANLT
ncbi:MAG: ankyrin repeat domain-containing protein [Magnetococcales bacterium]|nr:ankyrin repeat domain-containing protein [Magnetococcales bacterium]